MEGRRAVERRHPFIEGIEGIGDAKSTASPAGRVDGMPAPGEHHPAFEEYCECIFELDEDSVDVIQARIVDRLQISRPAVSEMIRRLEAEQLIVQSAGHIQLTETGMHLAQQTVRRHRLAERFLTDMLGLPWAQAHHEAGRWEHVMSDQVEKAMDRVLGSPTTCPHGNPIPGSKYIAPDTITLADVKTGSRFTVSRITEELEFEPGLLDYLESSTIQPGQTGTVTSASPDGTLTIEINGHYVGVGAFASARILVSA
jgi:DtxR family transcriptional regulator, Mn-dependent transcriptional regulator